MIVVILDYFKFLMKKSFLLRFGKNLKKRFFFVFYYIYLVLYNILNN